MPTAADALSEIWTGAGLPADSLADATLTGDDPVLPSSFAVARAAQVSIAASALAAAALWRLRTGKRQAIAVDARDAAIEFRSERYFTVNGQKPGELWDDLAGLHACRDGGWVRLHTNFPHHRAGVLALLGCAPTRAAVGAALAGWNAKEFEAAADAAGLAVAAYRDAAAWDASEQGRAVAATPLVSIERIGDAPPRPLPVAGSQPLSGVRVLDLTRVIAGPVCGRTLAGHGADVLAISAAHLPTMADLVVDTGRGKRSAQLDLRQSADRDRLRGLLAGADIFLQGYRPGALTARDFGPQDTAREKPGIVHVSLSAYGDTGPWGGKRGFDSLAQTTGGLNAEEAAAAGQSTPRALPAQALDHASGYWLAFGAMAALHRRAIEGGSWHVRVALARTGLWLRGLPRVADGFAVTDPGMADIADRLETVASGFGALSAVRHAAVLASTPYRHARPSVPLGTDPPGWPD